jgi:hypothetical protein
MNVRKRGLDRNQVSTFAIFAGFDIQFVKFVYDHFCHGVYVFKVSKLVRIEYFF